MPLTCFPARHPVANPVCSVCIANYNGRDTLDQCIHSVLDQTRDFEVEIIIHDDASTDGSVDYLQESYNDAIKLLVSEENVGFCISNNRMVEEARGEYVLLLNNDAALRPLALKSLYDYSRRQAKPGILGIPQYQMQTGRLVDYGNLFDLFLTPYPNLDPERRLTGTVTGGCLWISRDLWIKIGGFPEWFHTVAEDIYLCFVARLWGYPVEVLPVSGFDHWIGKNLGGGKVVENQLVTTIRRRALSERNRLFTMILCYPGISLWLIFPVHLLVLIIEGLILSLVKWDFELWKRIYWAGLWETWQKRHFLRRQRQRIQALRRVRMREFFAPHTWFPHKLRMLMRYGLPKIK